MSTPVVLDLILVAVLCFFAILGARRGFVLTLCSLLAVVVALVGANLAADALAPRLSEALEPRLERSIQESLEQAIRDPAADPEEGSEAATAAAALTALWEKGGLYAWAADSLQDALDAGITETAAQIAATAAAAVAEQLAHGILFLIAFCLILLIWTVLSHALDLVARLPGLNGVNRSLGAVLGLVKGLIILYLAIWVLCTLTDLVPADTVAQTHLLAFLHGHSPLELVMLSGTLFPGQTAAPAVS